MHLPFAARLGDDERRIRAALGWMSGLDPSMVAWDTGVENASNLNGARTDDRDHTWLVLNGQWRRTDGNINAFGDANNRAAVVETEIRDVYIAVDLPQSHGGTAMRDHGIVLRADPESNSWLIVTVDQVTYDIGTVLRLEGHIAGTRTVLTSVTIPEVQRYIPIRLFAQVRHNDVVAGINGIPLLRHTLSGGNEEIYTGTMHGLGTRNSETPTVAFLWRNFAVWRAVIA